MSDQEAEEEPSIEEILTSIRQIISDDDEEGEGEEAAPAEEAVEDASEPEPEVESDSAEEASSENEEVIELNEAVEEEAAKSEPEPDSTPEPEPEEPAAEPEPEPEPIEVDMQEAEPEPEDVPDMNEADTGMDTFVDSSEVLTDEAKAAALESFTELAKKTAVSDGGITIEDIVRSELKPLLRDWLDKNLPSLIERLVQDELEKISKRAMDDE